MAKRTNSFFQIILFNGPVPEKIAYVKDLRVLIVTARDIKEDEVFIEGDLTVRQP